MPEFSFYLNNLSFQYPEGLQIEELREKIEQLEDDCKFIREKDERIYRHESVYSEKIFEDWDLMDMYNPEFQEVIGRDYSFLLPTIIDQSIATDIDNELVIACLEEHSEQEVNGLLCLHEIAEVDAIFCVYNRNNWFDFHRYFLGLYPIDEKFYANSCTIYFPDLNFHPNTAATLKTLKGGGLKNFSIIIVKCLTHLNDDFSSCHIHNNIPATLKRFSTICGLDVSNEGNADRKKDLTFNFIDTKGNRVKIYCEPHIKISKSDLPSDNTHHFNRLYFHVGKPEIANGAILIAHIGKHL